MEGTWAWSSAIGYEAMVHRAKDPKSNLKIHNHQWSTNFTLHFFAKNYGWFLNANVKAWFIVWFVNTDVPVKAWTFKKRQTIQMNMMSKCVEPQQNQKVIKQQYQKLMGHWSRNVEGVATQPGKPERHSSSACCAFFPSPWFLSVVPLPFWILLDFLLGAWHFSAATCHLLPCLCLQ